MIKFIPISEVTMPRDFRSFTKESHSNTKSTTEKYEDILNKYKNMNSNELMQNLFLEASKLKKEGKLSSDALNSLKSNLFPYLNAEQKEMLNSLINALNEQT